MLPFALLNLEPPVVVSPPQATIAVEAYAPAIPELSYVTKSFTWDSEFQGWTYIASGGAVAGVITIDGQPPGGVFTNLSGANKGGSINWQWSGQFTELGVPAGATIVGIDQSSIQSRVAVYTTGVPSIISVVSVSPVGHPTLTVAGSRSVNSVDSAWTTQTGIDASGLSIPSETSLVIGWVDTVSTGNSISANVNVRHDNLTFRVAYLSTGVATPAVRSVQATGLAPEAMVSDTSPVIETGAAAASVSSVEPLLVLTSVPVTPTATPFGLLALTYNTPSNKGGGGPGGLLALALNLELPAGVKSPVVGRVGVTGYAPFTGEPIVDVGTGDDLESGPAALSGSGLKRSINEEVIPTLEGAVATGGLAPVLSLNIVLTPAAGGIGINELAPLPTWAGTITPAAGTVTTFGEDVATVEPPEQYVIMVPIRRVQISPLTPAIFEFNNAASPGVGAASYSGYAPDVSDGLLVAPGAAIFAGAIPAVTGSYLVTGDGVLASRRGSTSTDGRSVKEGVGEVQAQHARMTSVAVGGPSGAGVLDAGPGSLQGPIWRGQGVMRGVEAEASGFGLVLPYEFPTGERRAKGISPKERTRLRK